MDKKKLRELAEQRVQAKQGFFIHLSVYVLVNLFLLISYLNTTIDQASTIVFTAIFWGVGVLFHWYYVFIHSDLRKYEQRVTAEMEKMKDDEHK